MKIILKDSRTGCYYAGDQSWSGDVSRAMDFDSINDAAAWAVEKQLETVDVVLRYEKPTCELTLPLAVCVSGATVAINNKDRPRPHKPPGP